VISAKTIGFHYGKHHKGYVDNLKKLVPKRGSRNDLEKIISETEGKATKPPSSITGASMEPRLLLEKPQAEGRGGTPSGAAEKTRCPSWTRCLLEGTFGPGPGDRSQAFVSFLFYYGSGWVGWC
jgi:Fe-Mn family superoxide dismutase